MREVGTLVWVVLIIVGVVGSMVSSVRRQLRAQQGQAPPARQYQRTVPAAQQSRPAPAPAPQERPMAPARPQPARPAATAPADGHGGGSAASAARRRLFPQENELVRAVIAAEVLGKPRALSDEYLRR
jgi:predicted lipid-binding transport protein (Tim44 family)